MKPLLAPHEKCSHPWEYRQAVKGEHSVVVVCLICGLGELMPRVVQRPLEVSK